MFALLKRIVAQEKTSAKSHYNKQSKNEAAKIKEFKLIALKSEAVTYIHL